VYEEIFDVTPGRKQMQQAVQLAVAGQLHTSLFADTCG
jgi:hypothetical protein